MAIPPDLSCVMARLAKEVWKWVAEGGGQGILLRNLPCRAKKKKKVAPFLS